MRKMMMLIGLAIIAGLIFFPAKNLHAHGVGYRHSELQAVTLEFFYSTGEKMSYREARVYSPKDSKFAAQTGRTDEHGRFAFIPDMSGEWRVIVRDEEGHQCEAKITVSETLSVSDSVNDHSSGYSVKDLWLRAILGVSILFNIAMIILRRSKNAY